jgi:hypothetical protein|tara:strand:+ start:804 stop:977 length:174 start_codon:yes stop_codon:yes gene_type:complete
MSITDLKILLGKLVEALDTYEDNVGFGVDNVELAPHEELATNNLFAIIKEAREASNQ